MVEDDVSPADIEAQTLLALEVRDAVSTVQEAVARIRFVRNQLDDALNGLEPETSLRTRAEEMVISLDAIENALVQTKTGQVGSQLKPKLLRQLTYLYGMLSRADQAPGEDAYLRLQDIQVQLQQQL